MRPRLTFALCVAAWLYVSLWHGLPWAVQYSRYFAPGVNFLMLFVIAFAWSFLVVPAGYGVLKGLLLPVPQPTPRFVRVERIILEREIPYA